MWEKLDVSIDMHIQAIHTVLVCLYHCEDINVTSDDLSFEYEKHAF